MANATGADTTVAIGADGYYEFPALAQDAYQFEFNGVTGANGDEGIWATEWYEDDHDGPTDRYFVADGNTGTIDATLERFGTVSGTVRSQLDTNVKLDGVEIELRDYYSGAIFSATTDSNGDYSITGLEPSTYTAVYRYREVTQWSGGHSDAVNAEWFVVGYNQTVDRDEDLLWTGKIYGNVKDTPEDFRHVQGGQEAHREDHDLEADEGCARLPVEA
jgi:hypothetical protein